MIDAIKRQFEDRWRREKIVLVPGPNKADNICGKTMVTGTMQRGSTVLIRDVSEDTVVCNITTVP
jgi:hypothetical protein